MAVLALSRSPQWVDGQPGMRRAGVAGWLCLQPLSAGTGRASPERLTVLQFLALT